MGMPHETKLKPGCFGSAIYFSDDAVCSACPFALDCEQKHIQAKRALQDHFGIKIDARKSVNGKKKMTKKSVELLDRLSADSDRITKALKQGKNPFDRSHRFLQVICHILINRPTVTRMMLCEALEQVLHHKHETAQSQVRISLEVFDALGLIERSGDRYGLNRE